MSAAGTHRDPVTSPLRPAAAAATAKRRSALDAARDLARDVRALPTAGARFRLLALRLRWALGGGSNALPVVGQGPRTVLFVCHGNIMRSPTAEVLLRSVATARGDLGLRVASAGLRAINGRPADPRSRAAAARYGISLEAHRAQRLDRRLVDWAQAIFVMDWRNAAELVDRFPDADAKLYLLGAFAPDAAGVPVIGDPYTRGEDAADACFRQLAAAVDRVAPHLVRAVPSNVPS